MTRQLRNCARNLDALLDDIKIAAIKIGMLGHRGNAVVVAEFLDRAGVAHVVLDPVMKSTSGENRFDRCRRNQISRRRITEARDRGDAEYRRS